MKTAENEKENKHFTEKYVQQAIKEAIEQDKACYISNEPPQSKLCAVSAVKIKEL
ncbi:hypothetical protein AGMMS49990_10640 [Endomicrobiia bacterium]|nr:hypothetical protein AGMMS49990_10640 [Endomicrobiia bacterium]